MTSRDSDRGERTVTDPGEAAHTGTALLGGHVGPFGSRGVTRPAQRPSDLTVLLHTRGSGCRLPLASGESGKERTLSPPLAGALLSTRAAHEPDCFPSEFGRSSVLTQTAQGSVQTTGRHKGPFHPVRAMGLGAAPSGRSCSSAGQLSAYGSAPAT